MLKGLVMFIGLLILSALPLRSQVCCVQPYSEVSTPTGELIVNEVDGTHQIGEIFYATLAGSINFNGNWVGESTESPGSDSCWWAQSPIPQHPGVSNPVYPPSVVMSTWPVAGTLGHDQYGNDYLSLNLETVINPIRQHWATQYSGTPGVACTFTAYQQMNYSCNGGTVWQAYWDNTLNEVLYAHSFQISRGTATVTILNQ